MSKIEQILIVAAVAAPTVATLRMYFILRSVFADWDEAQAETIRAINLSNELIERVKVAEVAVEESSAQVDHILFAAKEVISSLAKDARLDPDAAWRRFRVAYQVRLRNASQA